MPLEPELEPVEPVELLESLSVLEPVEPVEPVEPEPAEPLDEVSLPVAPDDPLDDPEPIEPEEDPLEPAAPLDDVSLLEPVEPELPVAPAPRTSISVACTVLPEPEPEKLARTSSPSWMDDRDASLPSFITFVLELSLIFLSLPESVRVLFCASNFSTRPWIWLCASLIEPEPLEEPYAELPDEPELPELLPIDPELELPVEPEPLALVSDEPDDSAEPVEPVALDPVDPEPLVLGSVALVEPLLPCCLLVSLEELPVLLCACAGGAARSSPASPSPATTLHPLRFIIPLPSFVRPAPRRGLSLSPSR